MNLANIGGIFALQNYCILFDNATLTFYSGTQPSTPETALSGNTALAAFTWTASAFGTPTVSGGYATATANFTASTVTPSNSGTCTFARAVIETTSAWTASHTYSAGTTVTNNSNYYICVIGGTSAASGGPTMTGLYILDSTAVWAYIGPSSGNGVLGDFTVGTSGADIIVGSTAFSTGVQVNLSSFKLQIPVV